VPSWRPAAIGQFAAQWQGPGQLAVLIIPEPSGGQRFACYHDKVQWERTAGAGTASASWSSSSPAALSAKNRPGTDTRIREWPTGGPVARVAHRPLLAQQPAVKYGGLTVKHALKCRDQL
jgi:hypothetical protein